MTDDNKKGDTQDLPRREVNPFQVEPNDSDTIPWVIEFRIGGGLGLLRVQVRERMMVGRGTGSQGTDVDLSPFRAQENGVSRRHAIILARKKFLTIRDLNSTNGTYLNGLRIMPDQDMPLEHGDKIKFGRLETQVMFSVVPPDKLPTADTVDTGLLTPISTGRGEHVLVLEDDHDVSMVYQMVLEEAGYRVTLTRDATEAAAAFLENVPDLVILDVLIKDEITGRASDGMDVLRILHNRTERMKIDIPFVVVSGMNDIATQRNALESGADMFLKKPIRVDELVMHVGDLLEKRKHG